MMLLVWILLFLSNLLLAWSVPTHREDGTTIKQEEIAHYSLYRDGELYDHLTTNELTIKKYKGCHTFYVTATDTNDLTSQVSNEIRTCHNKGKKR